MTEEEKIELQRALATFVEERVALAIKPLRERVIEMEKRGLNYCGVYQKAAVYRRGDVVTESGSMHVAIADVIDPSEAPNGSNKWQLCVKRGADGRDGTRSPTAMPARRSG